MKSEDIKETHFHDAGAYGRCANCGRYSLSQVCLHKTFMCDCGKSGCYTGSFIKPDAQSKWCNNMTIKPPK